VELKPGSRWRSAVCDTEIAIVRPPKIELSLECGGHPVIPHADPRPDGLAVAQAHSGGTLVGKRYFEDESGLEVLCTKAGAGSLSVNGVTIPIKEAKKLPSSD
jgi:hypothetical protein